MILFLLYSFPLLFCFKFIYRPLEESLEKLAVMTEICKIYTNDLILFY